MLPSEQPGTVVGHSGVAAEAGPQRGVGVRLLSSPSMPQLARAGAAPALSVFPKGVLARAPPPRRTTPAAPRERTLRAPGEDEAARTRARALVAIDYGHGHESKG